MTNEQRRNVKRYLKSKHNSPVRRRIEGEKIHCEKCRSTADLEWHHVVPFSQGGDDSDDNLQVLCHACHVALHQHLDDYRDAGRWGGLVSAVLREERLGREGFCEAMRSLAQKRWVA